MSIVLKVTTGLKIPHGLGELVLRALGDGLGVAGRLSSRLAFLFDSSSTEALFAFEF
jgi:hypothetical protein